MTNAAVFFILIGWIVVFAIYLVSGVGFVASLRNHDIKAALICAGVAILASVPILSVGL